MITTYGRQIMCEPYKGKREIKSELRGGVAMMSQKANIVGLKLVADAKIDANTSLKAGDTVFLKEESVFNNKGAYVDMAYTVEEVGAPFILLDFSLVMFVKHV